MTIGRRTVGVAALVMVACAPACGDEPRLLQALEDAGWRASRVAHALPPLEVRSKEDLEFQDFVQLAYDGGTLRLVAGPDGERILGLIADTRDPRRIEFTGLHDSSHWIVHRDDPWTVVLHVAPIDVHRFTRLKSRRWTETELVRQLGPPSSHGHWHGIGFLEMTWVPEGLRFVGDTPDGGGAPEYELFERFMPGDFDYALPPLDRFAALDYGKMETSVRGDFARDLVRARHEIDGAFAKGKSSPDGRFVVGLVNLGRLANTQECVVREPGKAEHRYPVGYFMHDEDVVWLNARTILYRIAFADAEFHTLDAATGADRLVSAVTYESGRKVTDYGVSTADAFWYTTDDGVRHTIDVAAPP